MNRADVLTAAENCVCRDRQSKYGTPESNFSKIARLWSEYLGYPDISAADVACMMGLLKMARIRTGAKNDDNWVDLAGYAACGAEVDENAQLQDCASADTECKICGTCGHYHVEPYYNIRVCMHSCRTTDYEHSCANWEPRADK